MPIQAAPKKVLLILTAGLLLLTTPATVEAYKPIHACGPTWAELPVQYLINEQGSRDLDDFSKLESLIHASFQAWQEPCCSDFSSEYIGTTEKTEVLEPGPIIISFADENFPRQFGGSETIAITYSMLFYETCTINQAVIVFNGADHRFFHAETEESPAGESYQGPADFQSIATHEVGHLLGLGHSHFQQATMYSYYMGGTEFRSLHADDIKGVCSLYPSVCTCATNQDCIEGQQCIQGGCEDIPCTADSQCEGRLICLDGACVAQPCSDDNECASGFQCMNDVCVSECPTCRPCTHSQDCDNGFCLDIEQETNKCFVSCTGDFSCPGDSICIDVSQGDEPLFVCMNPDVENAGLCPDDYVCKDVAQIDSEPGNSSTPNRKFQSTGCAITTTPGSPRKPDVALLLVAGFLVSRGFRKALLKH